MSSSGVRTTTLAVWCCRGWRPPPARSGDVSQPPGSPPGPLLRSDRWQARGWPHLTVPGADVERVKWILRWLIPHRRWRVVMQVDAADELPASIPRMGAVLVGCRFSSHLANGRPLTWDSLALLIDLASDPS